LAGNLARKFHRSNSNRAWATRAASGIFVNFGEIQGYFSILHIQWHSGNLFGVPDGIFDIFVYINACKFSRILKNNKKTKK